MLFEGLLAGEGDQNADQHQPGPNQDQTVPADDILKVREDRGSGGGRHIAEEIQIPCGGGGKAGVVQAGAIAAPHQRIGTLVAQKGNQ